MHSKNLAEAKASMEAGLSPVIIDNTNIRANEAKAYVEHALRLGYADGNIQIVDVGTAGLTVEQLAARNTHGVPVDKIKDMVKNHANAGELTLKKIIESKDMYTNDILYSAVVLDEKSHSKLLANFAASIPEGWKTFAHHMTIAFGKPAPNKEDVGKTVELEVTELGKSDMAVAVKVTGYASNNQIAHITLAINPEGGKPVMSNQITDWKKVGGLKLTGVVTNIKKS